MGKQLLCIGILLALSWTIAEAQQRKDGAYFCTVEFAGGLSYNADLKRWQSATFRPTGKFVLRLRFVKSPKEKLTDQFEANYEDYEATITEAGQNRAKSCTKGQIRTATLDEYGFLSCEALLQGYQFNLKAMRFLQAYLIGYVNGIDEKGDTPSVSGGTCTKID